VVVDAVGLAVLAAVLAAAAVLDDVAVGAPDR